MSDGGRERAPVAVEVLKSSQKWSVQRSAVRSIAWLDDLLCILTDFLHELRLDPNDVSAITEALCFSAAVSKMQLQQTMLADLPNVERLPKCCREYSRRADACLVVQIRRDANDSHSVASFESEPLPTRHII
jgi:hypothetical protein